MDKLVIEGGNPLEGRIRVSGSKNAALPLLLAALAVTGPVTYSNVPALRDIHTTLKLLEILGCDTFFARGEATIHSRQLNPEAPYELVKTMRASVLCLGPLLARLGEARVALPGGCAIGARPVDIHLRALEAMGAEFTLESGYIHGTCKALHGTTIQFDFPTVGGTENILMASALAQGTSTLVNVAREPEIIDLADFLNACGARITGQGTSVITVEGVPELTGTAYRVMPDRIEAGTFLCAAAMTGGQLLIEECPLPELDAVTFKLREMGVWIEERDEGVLVERGTQLTGVDVTTLPHPGFPTDMQAQIMTLLCLARGSAFVKETIFENRFMHVSELARMGANIALEGNSALVRGVRELTGAPVMASDLRASASLVMAGLAAKGTTEVSRIYHLDRGYEQLEKKLRAVGATIQRVKMT